MVVDDAVVSDAQALMPPARVVGGRAVSLRGRLVVAVFWVGYLSWIVVSRDYESSGFGVGVAVFTAWTFWRPLTVVDAHGVWAAHRVRRGPTLMWARVDAVVEPRSYDNQVDLIMNDGTVRGLALVAATDAASVARIGGKQLRPRPTASSVPGAPRLPNQMEQDQALTVRAQRLAVERDHLHAQLPHPKTSG